jgi:hypothetical protein
MMNACVIMHNMMIESEHGDPDATDMTLESQGPLAEVNQEVSDEFGAFSSVHQEIFDEQFHVQLHDDLVKHLWAIKRKRCLMCPSHYKIV